MSKTLEQVFIANPIITNNNLDLMYFSRSPYTAGNDVAMTYADFAAQFSGGSNPWSAGAGTGSAIGGTGCANAGDYGFAYGSGCANAGNESYALGGNTSISAGSSYSLIGGFNSTYGSGSYSLTWGNSIVNFADTSTVFGSGHTINGGQYAFVWGQNNRFASLTNSFVAGTNFSTNTVLTGIVAFGDSVSNPLEPFLNDQFSASFKNGFLFNIDTNATPSTAVGIDDNGNLINKKGAADQSYSLQAPSNGFSITIAARVKTLVLNPAGLLATGTIIMPAAPIDGQQIVVSAENFGVTALTVSPNSGQTISNEPTTLAAGQGFRYQYNLANTNWMPIYQASSGGGSGVTDLQVQENAFNIGTDSGSANAYAFSLTPTLLTYVQNAIYSWVPANTNTISNPTVQIDGLGVLNLLNYNGEALLAGDIVTGNAANFQYSQGNAFLLNPQVSLAVPTNVQKSVFNVAPDTGAVNSYIGTYSPAISALTEGLTVTLSAVANTNTGATNFDAGPGAQSVIDLQGNPLIGGEIVAGNDVTLKWNVTLARWVLQDSALTTYSGATAIQVQSWQFNHASDSGAVNAYIGVFSPPISTPPPNGIIYILDVITASNTGAATLDIGTGAKAITAIDFSPLTGGEILGPNSYAFIYNFDFDTFTLLNASAFNGILKSPSGIADPSGNVLASFNYVASAVNYIEINNNATGFPPAISAIGTDTDIGLTLVAKGTGAVSFLGEGGTTNLALFTSVPSAVNYLNLFNAPTATSPALWAQGTDTDINLGLAFKGNAFAAIYDSTGVNAATLLLYNAGNTNFTSIQPHNTAANYNAQFPAYAGTIVLDSVFSAAWTDFSGTLSFTGFSVDPVVEYARYKMFGNTLFYEISISTAGTSNATTFTMPGMPATAANFGTQWQSVMRAQNAGVEIYVNAQAYIAPNTNVLTLRLAGSDSGWSNILGKYANVSGFYETT